MGPEQVVMIDVSSEVVLEGRLGLSQGARAGLVVCHPHPLYGGDMDNPVVVRAVEVAHEEGIGTLRFNFRGVGGSTGVHAQGEGEQADLRAVMARMRLQLSPGCKMAILGYSFGAWIAALVAAGESIDALGLIAPPIAMIEFGPLADRNQDILLAAGTRDTYCPAPALQAMTDRTPGARAVIVDGADHFFFGKLFPLGEAIREWARRWAA